MRNLRICSKEARLRLTRAMAWYYRFVGYRIRPFESFGPRGIDGDQGGQVRLAVADRNHMADNRLQAEQLLDARRVDLLALERTISSFLRPLM